jgi:hypothetical protein
MPKVPGRVRWVVSAALFLLSFFGKAPVDALDWLFTSRGRLALLLLGLAIGFWPQLSRWAIQQWLTVRPVSKKRLRRDTQALVVDLRAYMKASPEPFAVTVDTHQQTVTAMNATADQAEKDRLWNAYKRDLVELWGRNTQEFAGRFGGRISYVMDEFARLGLLDGDARNRLMWQTETTAQIMQATNSLEALALRL